MRARILSRSLRLATVLAVVGMAASAQATPIVYTMVGGPSCVVGPTENCVTITATDAAGTVFNQQIGLTGSQVTFDDSGKNIPSFQFTAGPTGALPLIGDLAGVTIALNSVTVGPGAGYPTIMIVNGPPSGPGTYPFTIASVSASANGAFGGAITGPFSFTTPPPPPVVPLSGQVQLGAFNQFSLNGIALGGFTALPIPSIGFPGGSVTIKADLVFTGVPEPTTASLLGVGLAGIAGALRRRARD